MIKFLIRIFIKDSENISDKKVREHYGILGGILGVICSLFLFGLKLAIGTIMNSIAIISEMLIPIRSGHLCVVDSSENRE